MLKSITICAALLAASLLAPVLADNTANTIPKGWFIAGSTPEQFEFGAETCGNSKCAFIKSKTDTPTGFGTLMQEITAENYTGKRLRLSAMLKTANANRAQLWMRMDGAAGKMLGFYNMDDRPVTGTTDWKRYSLVLDVPGGTQVIAFGMFLNGKGEVWAEDYKLEPVGKNVPVSSGNQINKVPVNMDFSD